MEQGRRSRPSRARERALAPALCLALTLIGAPLLAASPAAAGSSPDFADFCAAWMAKLRAREADNARTARIVQVASEWVGEFTGYGRKPLHCTARPTGSPSAPFVGHLVYEEIVYRKKGASPKDARGSEPEPAVRTRVMEIFKFDGVKWVW